MGAVDVDKIAEAVLYEGYLLFPYRRSSMKNQQRWTFGGVYPKDYSEATGGDDPWTMQTQCLLFGDADTTIEVKVRFLHAVDRKVTENSSGSPRFVEEIRVGATVYRSWEEAIEREILPGGSENAPPLRIVGLLAHTRRFPIDIPAGAEVETLIDENLKEVGALVREWRGVRGVMELSAERLDMPAIPACAEAAGRAVYRLTARIENRTPWPLEGGDPLSRPDAVRHSMISTHTILHVSGGEFISLLEPPDALQQDASRCENVRTWPVLVGEPSERQTMLSSPIILYDYPQVSPESQGNYFDATEIDELLALSVMTLTEDEKQEMREGDRHGREILERTESLSEEQLLKMHGVIRYLQPLTTLIGDSPATPSKTGAAHSPYAREQAGEGSC